MADDNGELCIKSVPQRELEGQSHLHPLIVLFVGLYRLTTRQENEANVSDPPLIEKCWYAARILLCQSADEFRDAVLNHRPSNLLPFDPPHLPQPNPARTRAWFA